MADRGGNVDAKRLRSFQIDHQMHLGWLLNGPSGRGTNVAHGYEQLGFVRHELDGGILKPPHWQKRSRSRGSALDPALLGENFVEGVVVDGNVVGGAHESPPDKAGFVPSAVSPWKRCGSTRQLRNSAPTWHAARSLSCEPIRIFGQRASSW